MLLSVHMENAPAARFVRSGFRSCRPALPSDARKPPAGGEEIWTWPRNQTLKAIPACGTVSSAAGGGRAASGRGRIPRGYLMKVKALGGGQGRPTNGSALPSMVPANFG